METLHILSFLQLNLQLLTKWYTSSSRAFRTWRFFGHETAEQSTQLIGEQNKLKIEICSDISTVALAASTLSRLNWNLEMLVFVEGGKPENPAKRRTNKAWRANWGAIGKWQLANGSMQTGIF